MAFSPKHFARLVFYVVSWPVMAVATVIWALGEKREPNSPSPIRPDEWN
jgi:hypothetical protein